MVVNRDGFNVLATLPAPIDCVVRHSETAKLDFPGVPFVETKLTDRYGYQVVIGAYGEPGKWPILVPTSYSIERPRVEIAIPSSCALDFLLALKRSLPDAIKEVRTWERMKGLR